MGNVQVEALLHALGADGSGQHAFFAVDGVDLGAGGIARAGHKLLVTGSQQQFFAVGSGFALGLGVIQKRLVALAEVLRSRDGLGRSVGYRLILIEQIFQFLGSFHLEVPFFLTIYLRIALVAFGDFPYILPHLRIGVVVQRNAV